jgi:hypothetical protein
VRSLVKGCIMSEIGDKCYAHGADEKFYKILVGRRE